MPQPDSPTRPTLSPRFTSKLMPPTARNGFAASSSLRPNSFMSEVGTALRLYSLTRSSTTSSGAPAPTAARLRHRCVVGVRRQEIAQSDAETRRRPHQLPGVGVLGRGENLARRRGLHHLALLHHDHAVAIGGGEAEIVGDEDGRHAALARELDHEVHHRLLGRDVEAGGRLVGDQELRLAGERERDHDALAHAARQLERIGVVALLRIGDAHPAQRIDRLLLDVGGHRLHVLEQDVLDLLADLADRIERGARVLEDHRDLAAAQIAHLAIPARCARRRRRT